MTRETLRAPSADGVIVIRRERFLISIRVPMPKPASVSLRFHKQTRRVALPQMFWVCSRIVFLCFIGCMYTRGVFTPQAFCLTKFPPVNFCKLKRRFNASQRASTRRNSSRVFPLFSRRFACFLAFSAFTLLGSIPFTRSTFPPVFIG